MFYVYLVLGLLVTLGVMAWLWDRLDPNYEFNSAYRQFHADADRRGLNAKQRQEELFLRTQLAKVRRLASKRVEANPDRAIEITQEEVAAAIQRLSYSNKLAARRFKSASADWLLFDLVYPDVAKKVMKHWQKTLKPLPKVNSEALADHINAMKTPYRG